MCTLVIAWQVLTDAPVAVAANRDEVLDRPSKPPALLDGAPRVVAPRDGEAGGTWLGYNEHRLVAGLSNRWTDAEPAGERSRGRLVLDVLAASSADEATSVAESAVRRHAYRPFNLLVADADAAVVSAWDGRLRVAELSPGVHALLNAGWDDQFEAVEGRESAVAEQLTRSREVRAALAVEPGESADRWLDRAEGVLADHDLGVCVHGDGYGTRSSSLIAVRDGGDVVYRFADGPPCQARFVPVEAQI